MPFFNPNASDVHLVRLELVASTHFYDSFLLYFNSCRGLKVLVELLDEDYSEQADLVAHALNGVGSVFELQVRAPSIHEICMTYFPNLVRSEPHPKE